jgi:hypothetical protein
MAGGTGQHERSEKDDKDEPEEGAHGTASFELPLRRSWTGIGPPGVLLPRLLAPGLAPVFSQRYVTGNLGPEQAHYKRYGPTR